MSESKTFAQSVPVGEATSLAINEIFGPTFQGEGPLSGQVCTFLRLAGCNLTCVWCDTPYTWRFSDKLPHQNETIYDRTKEIQHLSIPTVLSTLEQHKLSTAGLLVITGGEPLLQVMSIHKLMSELPPEIMVMIETNGTRQPGPLFDFSYRLVFSVSPKLENSKVATKLRYSREAIDALARTPNHYFKFVVVTEEDITEIELWQKTNRIPNERIWLMPEGNTRQDQLAHMGFVADQALKHFWNFTQRSHTLLWDAKRGV